MFKPTRTLAGIAAAFGVLWAAVPASASHTTTACSADRTVRYSDSWHTYYGQTWFYAIRQSSFPSWMDKTKTIARIRDGVRVWTTGKNRCGYASFSGFQAAYLGDSTKAVAFDPSNGESTISFSSKPCGDDNSAGCARTRSSMHLDSFAETWTTQAGVRYKARESDVQFPNLNYRLTRSTQSCRTAEESYDLQGKATHEIGHVVGLGDTYKVDPPKNYWQVMGYGGEKCDFRRRSLGRADWNGLKKLYTLR